MLFVKNYSVDADYGPWGAAGTTIHLDIQADTLNNAHMFIADLNNSFSNIRTVIPESPRGAILTCNKCFATTKICYNVNVTNIGFGDDVVGGCAYCDNVFMGSSHGAEI